VPTEVQITSPADGATLSSPLAIVCVKYSGTTARSAVIKVGTVKHIIELPKGKGEIRENVTLLEGDNVVEASIGRTKHQIAVTVPPSANMVIASPGVGHSRKERATQLSGSYENVSCPAGVIAVNGFMQQFAVPQASGQFHEMVVLRPGANHMAVQIGEFYVTRLVKATFKPARILATLVWDTDRTDVDLYVTEPNGQSVYYSQKKHAGTLDVDRTSGFGPENYSISARSAKPGTYRIRVHYYSGRGVGRSEWTVRVIADEAKVAQQRETFYGILDKSNGSNSSPGGKGKDWNEVGRVVIGEDGSIDILPPEKKKRTSKKPRAV
jgi:uncharacterized protein YfaP (DUF2135 family)